MEGQTKTGFKFHTQKGVEDSISWARSVAKLETGKYEVIFDVIEGLLGEKHAAELYAHCGDSMERLAEELDDIMDVIVEDEQIKNS